MQWTSFGSLVEAYSWSSWTSRMPTAWYPFTLLTTTSWVLSEEVIPTLIECCHSDYPQPLKIFNVVADFIACTRQELKSLLGHLSHAATVIPQGQTFLRQLFALLSLNRAPHHYLRLNAGARADLIWWQTFLQDWNGTSFIPGHGYFH